VKSLQKKSIEIFNPVKGDISRLFSPMMPLLPELELFFLCDNRA